MPDFALIERLDRMIDSLLAGDALSEPTAAAIARLADIAAALRELPDDRFKTRLGAELRAAQERRIPVSASTTAAPAAIHAITPFLSVPEGARLIDFMKHTFGAEETSRHPHGSGDGFVAAVKIGNSDILVMSGESARGPLAALHVYVKDCDAAYARALDAGAVTLGAPADRPYGERAGFVRDPFGNHWYIATRLGPDYFPQDLGHVTPCLHPRHAAPLIDFLERAFGAEVTGRHMEGGSMVHAFVKMGEAMLEMGEADDERSHSFGFYLYTDDVDAVYRQAMAAGAVSISPPADQAYGDRIAVLQDPSGNLWLPARRIAAGQ